MQREESLSDILGTVDRRNIVARLEGFRVRLVIAELSPELEAILNKIGLQRARKLDSLCAGNFATVCVHDILLDSGRWAPNPVEARASLKRFQKLNADITRVLEQLNSLTPLDAEYLNLFRDPESPRKKVPDLENWPDHIRATMKRLSHLQYVLLIDHKWHISQAARQTTGRPRNERAYLVAETLAKLYVVGKGRKPTYGRDPITKAPNGDFAPVVVEVFQALGIDVKDPIDPCEAACKGLDEAWVSGALDMLDRHGFRDAQD